MIAVKDGYGEVKDWVIALSVFLGLVLLIAVIIVAAMIGNNHTVHVDCLRLSEQTGLVTKTARSGPSIECYVNLPGVGFVPASRYRGVEVSE